MPRPRSDPAPDPEGKAATWIVGDVHGCFATLSALLRRAGIDPRRDRLVLVGDLVNRGPRSLDMLRWARARQDETGGRFSVVLGNHDLHLLAIARSLRPARPNDTLDAVLEAPDRADLIDWLAAQPLAVEVDGALVVHAGVEASWTVAETLQRASEVSAEIRGTRAAHLLAQRPPSDSPRARRTGGTNLTDRTEELRRDLETLTRVRMLDAEGRPSPYSGPPDEAPPGLVPWFEVPGRATADRTVVFGHWAALDLYVAPGLYGLDTGCAWGRRLTALRLDDGAVVQVEVADDEKREGSVSRPRREPPSGAG